MFEFLKKSLESYEQEKETPFNYNGLMSKLSNHRAETYMELANKTKELLNILDKSEVDNLSVHHSLGVPCGTLTSEIRFDGDKNAFDNKSQIILEVTAGYKLSGITIKSSDFPNSLKDARNKVEEMSRESLILLDDLTVHMDLLFEDIDKEVSKEIDRMTEAIKQPREELLNTLKDNYNDTEYSLDEESAFDYDYDDREF